MRGFRAVLLKRRLNPGGAPDPWNECEGSGAATRAAPTIDPSPRQSLRKPEFQHQVMRKVEVI